MVTGHDGNLILGIFNLVAGYSMVWSRGEEEINTKYMKELVNLFKLFKSLFYIVFFPNRGEERSASRGIKVW